jgi:hypothetical protein
MAFPAGHVCDGDLHDKHKNTPIWDVCNRFPIGTNICKNQNANLVKVNHGTEAYLGDKCRIELKINGNVFEGKPLKRAAGEAVYKNDPCDAACGLNLIDGRLTFERMPICDNL